MGLMRSFVLVGAALLSLLGASDAAASGRAHLRNRVHYTVSGGGGGGTPGAPAADQTFYFGKNTLVGDGGADACQGLCVGTVSGAETTSYYYDTSFSPMTGSPGLIVPKNGATKTYNSVRSTPLSGTEDMTLTDQGGHTMVVHLVADTTVCNYTIRWKNGDTQVTGSQGTNQLRNALNHANAGERVCGRSGTSISTVQNGAQGETNYNGTKIFRLGCTDGTCATRTYTSDADFVTIQPEPGGTFTIGPAEFDISVVKFSNITGDGEDETSCYYNNGTCKTMWTVGGNHLWFDHVTMSGNRDDDIGGSKIIAAAGGYAKSRMDAFKANAGLDDLRVTNSLIEYFSNGFSFAAPNGNSTTDVNQPAPVGLGGIVFTSNVVTNIAKDYLDISCAHHSVIKDNVFVDKRSSYTVGTVANNWINPFDSQQQFHGDFFQFDYATCSYGTYPGMDIENNLLSRGLGRDSLPPWDAANGVPNPNDYSGTAVDNSHIIQGAKIFAPNPTYGTASGQGIYASNFIAGTHKLSNGTTTRTFATIWDAPVVKNNVLMLELARGLDMPPFQGAAVITGNVVTAAHVPSAANLSDQSSNWGFALTSFINEGYTGTPLIDRNVFGGSPAYGTGYTGTNVNINNNSQATYFQDPATYPSPRSWADYIAGYRPIHGGNLEIDHVNHIYAGPLCWDGSAPDATGHCPA